MKVSCGGYHTVVVTSEDEIYAFGAGSYGECGYGEARETTKPRRVDLVPKKQGDDDEYAPRP